MVALTFSRHAQQSNNSGTAKSWKHTNSAGSTVLSGRPALCIELVVSSLDIADEIEQLLGAQLGSEKDNQIH